jgi:hypothetical protein
MEKRAVLVLRPVHGQKPAQPVLIQVLVLHISPFRDTPSVGPTEYSFRWPVFRDKEREPGGP